jgi:hypothetical protein
MNLCGIPQIVISDYLQAEGIERFGVYRTKLESLHEFKIPASFELFPDFYNDNPLAKILDQYRKK